MAWSCSKVCRYLTKAVGASPLFNMSSAGARCDACSAAGADSLPPKALEPTVYTAFATSSDQVVEQARRHRLVELN